MGLKIKLENGISDKLKAMKFKKCKPFLDENDYYNWEKVKKGQHILVQIHQMSSQPYLKIEPVKIKNKSVVYFKKHKNLVELFKVLPEAVEEIIKDNETKFQSTYKKMEMIQIPKFTNTRIMMMPLIIGDAKSIPPELEHYQEFIKELFSFCKKHKGKVGYLTIDEKEVKKGKTHRRKGKHVDGVFDPKRKKKPVIIYGGRPGVGSHGSWGGGDGAWGSAGNGMLTVASHEGCRAWNQTFEGAPYGEGDCEHLSKQCVSEAGEIFEAGRVYWLDGLCVHESLPMQRDTKRQFIRLSLPSTAPWFKGYTKNSLGIAPSGPILEKRKYMDVA